MKFLIFIAPLIFAQISIYSPESLKNQFKKGIQGSLGNFGNPPYDTSIIGHIWYPADGLGCSPILEQNPFDDFTNTIIMLDRGSCAFVAKVKNAQDVGAKAVVIVDNKPNEDATKVTMRDNGVGGNLFIPAYLIKKDDGDKIKDVLKINKDSVTIVMSFDMPSMPGLIFLDLWISSDNLLSLKFLQEFAPIGKQFTRDIMEFNPHYVFIKCSSCEAEKYLQEHEDCLGGGRYCAPDPDGIGPISGRDVVEEDLRQICMFKQLDINEDYSR